MIRDSHIGRKISRIRELREIKQEALAVALGVTRNDIAILENSEEVEEKQLRKVAKVLGVSSEGIKSFSDRAAIHFINNFYDHSSSQGPMGNYNSCTYHPVEQVINLYERMLAAEKEKIAYLEQLLRGKQE